MMRYNNQIKIMNGVTLVDGNIGCRVKMEVVLRDFHTGLVHREFTASGTFTGNGVFPIEGEPWAYAHFDDMIIANEVEDKYIGPSGWPLAQFLNSGL